MVLINECENDNYISYYITQNLFENDKDVANFTEIIKKQLCTSFRTVKHSIWPNSSYNRLLQLIDETKTNLALHIPYNLNNVFVFNNASRTDIRYNKAAIHTKNIVIDEADRGYIVRQEIASMLSILLNDIDKPFFCIDLCASPGSKTTQLIDRITNTSDSNLLEFDLYSCLIANDVNIQRARTLNHNVQKLAHPAVAITCSDACMIPTSFKFTTVLVDVPCSGDGTIRKNPDILVLWNTNIGITNYLRQLKLLLKAMKLVTNGGTVIYSTCSLNPIENEAVICSALNICDESFCIKELKTLDSFKTRSGLNDWNVIITDKNGKNHCFNSFDEFIKKNLNLNVSTAFKITKNLFANTYSEEIRQQLKRCVRVLPQDNDTGGFFICSLKKTNLKANKIINIGIPNKLKAKITADSVTVIPLLTGDKNLTEIVNFYGLYDLIEYVKNTKLDFMDYDKIDELNNLSSLYTKAQSSRYIYLATTALYYLYLKSISLNFISFGVQVFEKLDNNLISRNVFPYRISQTGARWLCRFMSKRKLIFEHVIIIKMLQNDGLSKKELYTYIENKQIMNISSCYNESNIIQPGGILITCTNNDPFVISALLTDNENITIYLKKNIKAALLKLALNSK